MSTSQTFGTNGMATHTYTHGLGGRAVNIYFVHHAEVILLRAQDGVLFPRWMYSKVAPDDHGTWFSARWRSEGMVRMAIGGVIWTILNLIQNDREKKNERLYIYIYLYIADGPCPSGARASPKIAVP